jgi:hypothetical protein
MKNQMLSGVRPVKTHSQWFLGGRHQHLPSGFAGFDRARSSRPAGSPWAKNAAKPGFAPCA